MARAQPYDVALRRHQMVQDAVALLGDEAARSAWAALTGRGEGEDAAISTSVMVTIDEDHVPMLRRASGIPAGFALRAMAEQLRGVDRADGLEVRLRIARAWDDFRVRLELANNVREGFGFDLSDAWETVRLVEHDSYRAKMVEEIAKLAGRMYRSMTGHKVKVEDATPQEVKGVEVGGRIERLLASEHAQMAHPVLGGPATIRWLQAQSQQLRMGGEHYASRGPLVVVLDSSGSMHDEWSAARAGFNDLDAGYCCTRGGGRNTWSKACAVALTRIAHEDGRMVRVVHFSTSVVPAECKPGDAEAVRRMAGTFLSGGTEIGRALRESVAQVSDLDKKGWKGADVVLVSDGGDYRSELIEESIDELKKRGVKLWTVAIDQDFGEDNVLRKEAAKYVHVHGDDLSVEATNGLEGAAFAGETRRR